MRVSHERIYHNCLSIFVRPSFPFGFEGEMWVLIVLVPDHCLSFYFGNGLCQSLVIVLSAS